MTLYTVPNEEMYIGSIEDIVSLWAVTSRGGTYWAMVPNIHQVSV